MDSSTDRTVPATTRARDARLGLVLGGAFASFGAILLLPGTFMPCSVAEQCDRLYAGVALFCGALLWAGTRPPESEDAVPAPDAASSGERTS